VGVFHIIGWLLVGLIAGWIAGKIVEGHGLGLLGDMVVGIIGAFIGGFIGSRLFGLAATGFNPATIILAVIGAVILLTIVKALTPHRAPV
jgi:uncharacterized membrane protein YeaQ/YmgE (transglycosylase-associated protein family)